MTQGIALGVRSDCAVWEKLNGLKQYSNYVAYTGKPLFGDIPYHVACFAIGNQIAIPEPEPDPYLVKREKEIEELEFLRGLVGSYFVDGKNPGVTNSVLQMPWDEVVKCAEAGFAAKARMKRQK